MSTTASTHPDNAAGGASIEDLAKFQLQSFLNETPNWLSSRQEPRDYARLFRMLEQSPHLSKDRFCGFNATAEYPLIYLLAAKAPLEMIQKVHQMNPKAIEMLDSPGYYPLHHAIRHQCNRQVVAFLLEKFPEAARGSTGGWGDDLPISILPTHLTREDFDRDNFDGQEFFAIFQLLYDAYDWEGWYLESSWPKLLSPILLSPDTPANMLAWLATKETREMCRLEILDELDDYKASVLVQNLNQFVPSLNCDCEELCLDFGGESLECNQLEQLLANVKIPSTLSFQIQYFNLVGAPSMSCDDFSSCQIMRLTIEWCTVATEALTSWLHILQTLPNLKELVLYSDVELCSTDSLIELLETAPKLNHLSLNGELNIDIKALSQALQKSKKSTSFVQYSPQGSQIPDVTIAYHSAMNHRGQARIGAPNASIATLVDCLCSVHGHASTLNRDQERIPNLEESVWYGLLRKAPGLWANSAAAGLPPGKRRGPLHDEATGSKRSKVE